MKYITTLCLELLLVSLPLTAQVWEKSRAISCCLNKTHQKCTCCVEKSERVVSNENTSSQESTHPTCTNTCTFCIIYNVSLHYTLCDDLSLSPPFYADIFSFGVISTDALSEGYTTHLLPPPKSILFL